ncbi:hypothetical protein GO001_34395 [Streptomyces sp. NRRL B-1677]|nr:hypothetical protein [Streptomyces sp. NRRL B-1677]
MCVLAGGGYVDHLLGKLAYLLYVDIIALAGNWQVKFTEAAHVDRYVQKFRPRRLVNTRFGVAAKVFAAAFFTAATLIAPSAQADEVEPPAIELPPAVSDLGLKGGNSIVAGSSRLTAAFFQNGFSKKCLEVRGDSNANGAIANQWTCNRSATQVWGITEYRDRYAGFNLYNGNSGKCLEIRGDSKATGALANQWQCNDSATQVWRFHPSGDGGYYITNANSGKCLEIRGDKWIDGATANQWTCNGSASQVWYLFT